MPANGWQHTTVSAHLPNSNQAHLECTPSRLIHWAEGLGSRPPRWCP
jgi:hypothetical protein